MASDINKILAMTNVAPRSKQAQVVVNDGAGRVNLPENTDASQLTKQELQKIIDTSPVQKVQPILPTEKKNVLQAAAKGLGYGTERAGAALLGFGEGITDFIGSTFYGTLSGITSAGGLLPNKVSEQLGQYSRMYLDNSVTQDYLKNIEERYKPTEGQKLVADVGSGVVDILAGISTGQAAGGIVKGLAGAGKVFAADRAAQTAGNVAKSAMTLSAAGKGASEAASEGASTERALAYGAAIGSLETVVEKIAGGIPTLGKGKLTKVVQNLVKNPNVAALISVVGEAMGEGGEEAASEVLTPFIKRAIYNKDAALATPEEISQSVLMGMISSGVLQVGLDLPSAFARNNSKTNTTTKPDNVTTEPGNVTTEPGNVTTEPGNVTTEPGNATTNTTEGGNINENVETINDSVDGEGTVAEVEEHMRKLTPKVLPEKITHTKEWDEAFYQATQAGQRLGVRVELAADLPDGVEGEYRNGVIRISDRAADPLKSTFVHELTHHLEATNSYAELREYVLSRADNALIKDGKNLDAYRKQIQSVYAAKGKTIDAAATDKEIVANYVEQHLFNDSREIAKLAKTHRNLVQIIRDWFENLRVKFRGTAQEKELLRAQRLFEKALRETDAKGYRTSGDGQWMVNPNFQNAYRAWTTQYPNSNITFSVGTTSKALQEIGVNERTIKWDSKKIRETKQKHPEITDAVIEQVPNLLENPIIVMHSKNPQYQSRITMFGEVYGTNGLPVMAVVELMPTDRVGNYSLDDIKVASTYTKTKDVNPPDIKATQNIINNSEILYVEPDKNKTNRWLSATGLQLPFAANYGLNKTLAQIGVNVNGQSSIRIDGDLLRASSKQERDYTANNGKIGAYLTAAINEESRAIGKALGVPYSRRGDFAKQRLRELANGYMETGTLDADLALSIFDEAWEQGKIINKDMYNAYQDLKRDLQKTKLQITDEVKRNIPDWESWRKNNRYKVGMTESGGVPIDQKYDELSGAYPNLFPENITDLASQLERMADVSAELYKAEKSLSEIYGDQTGENYKAMRRSFAERMNQFEKKLQQARSAQEERNTSRVRVSAPESVEAAKASYRAAKQARREYERTLGRSSVLLTDEQKRQVQALAAGQLTANEIPGSAAKDTILQLAEIRKRELDALAPLKAYKQQYRDGLRSRAAELLEGSFTWQDKASGLQYSRETMERNIRDMVKDKTKAANIIAEYFTPVHKSEAARTRFKNELRERVRNMRLTDRESEAVQYLGEVNSRLEDWETRGFKNIADKRDYEALKAERDNFLVAHDFDRVKVDRAIKEFREIYNDLFEQMNDVRIRNGYEPVDYRKNYFPHFLDTEPDSLVAKLGAALGIELKTAELPVDIAGRTHTFRPGIQWFGNAMQRTTDETVYDAVRGFDSYLEGISNVIYHTDNIQKLRALSNEIRYEGTEPAIQEQIDKIRADENISDYERDARIKELLENQPTKLSKFVQELEEYANILAGKKSMLDRNMEKLIGRKMYDFAKNLNNRVAANMVALNPGSWITNFAPLVQTASITNPITMARAMKDTVRSYAKNDGFADESTFLTNRRGSNPLVVTNIEKLSNALTAPMQWIDNFTSDTVVRARYYDNVKRGMEHQDALDEADSYAAGLIADRSKGALPTIFEAKNPVAKLFTAFQVEVNNQYSWMFKDLPRDERNKSVAMVAWKLLSLFIGSYLANDVYEKLRGNRVLFDPISMVNEAVGDITGYQLPNWADTVKNYTGKESALPFKELAQTEQSGVSGAVSAAAGNAASQLPFVGGLLDGGRVPISSALPDASQLVKLVDPEVSAEKKWNIAGKELLGKPLTYMVLPVGGGQLKKTVEGIATMQAGGSYTMDSEGSRKLQYPVDLGNGTRDILPWAQATVFGKSSLPQAKSWVDSGFKTSSVKFTEAYDYLQSQGVKTMDAYNLLKELQAIEKTEDASSTELKRQWLLENESLTPEQKTKVDQILIDADKTVDYTSAAAQRSTLATGPQMEKITAYKKVGGTAEQYWNVYDAVQTATWTKGVDGAKSKAIKAKIDAVASGMTKAQREKLYELFNVGKTYW